MDLPTVAVERLNVVPIVTGGIVDEAGNRTERRGTGFDQGLGRSQPREIGGKGGRLTALSLNLGDDREGLSCGSVIVDADAPTALCKIKRHRAAEAAASS